MADDITRHLAHLSESVVTDNMRSWEEVITQIENALEKKSSKYWTSAKLEFIHSLALSQEARLFRAGLSKVYLIISTSQKRGLSHGEHYLKLVWGENNLPVIRYCKFGKAAVQFYPLNSFDEPLLQLLPFLKRLWYESQDKLQAAE